MAAHHDEHLSLRLYLYYEINLLKCSFLNIKLEINFSLQTHKHVLSECLIDGEIQELVWTLTFHSIRDVR